MTIFKRKPVALVDPLNKYDLKVKRLFTLVDRARTELELAAHNVIVLKGATELYPESVFYEVSQVRLAEAKKNLATAFHTFITIRDGYNRYLDEYRSYLDATKNYRACELDGYCIVECVYRRFFIKEYTS